MKTLISTFAIALVLAAGCSQHKPVEAPEPEPLPRDKQLPVVHYWLTDDFVDVSHKDVVKIGSHMTISCGTARFHVGSEAARHRREALEDRLNRWFASIVARVDDEMKAGGDVRVVLRQLQNEAGQPIDIFLSNETLTFEDGNRSGFIERLAEELYFAERTLGMSLDQFVSAAFYHIQLGIEAERKDEVAIELPPDIKAEIADAERQLEHAENMFGTIESSVEQMTRAASALAEAEELFEAKRSGLTESEIREYERQIGYAKSAFQSLKERTEELLKLTDKEINHE